MQTGGSRGYFFPGELDGETLFCCEMTEEFEFDWDALNGFWQEAHARWGGGYTFDGTVLTLSNALLGELSLQRVVEDRLTPEGESVPEVPEKSTPGCGPSSGQNKSAWCELALLLLTSAAILLNRRRRPQ